MGIGFVNLFYLCRPFNILRALCCGISSFCLVCATVAFGSLFGITLVNFKVFAIFAGLVGISIPLHSYIPTLSDIVFERIKYVESNIREKRKKKKQIKEEKRRLKKGDIILNDTEEE